MASISFNNGVYMVTNFTSTIRISTFLQQMPTLLCIIILIFLSEKHSPRSNESIGMKPQALKVMEIKNQDIQKVSKVSYYS